MVKKLLGLVIAAVLATTATPSIAQKAPLAQKQEKGGLDLTGDYEWVPGWLQPIEEGRMIHPVTVFAESEDRVFIGLNGTSPAQRPDEHRLDWGYTAKTPGSRVDHQVFVVDRNGKMIEEWSQWQHLFGSMHKITMNPYDPEKHIWIIDRASQQLLKFTNDGKKLVFTVGERGVAGDDDKHFNRPADMVFLPDGTFFVADGFVNARVVKFDKNGKFLLAWGSKGKAVGQFNVVDAVTVDANRRVWVTDRKNGRIQIFDEFGKQLDVWTGFMEPMKVMITPDQFAWVLDGAAHRFAKFTMEGKLLDYWGVDSDPDRFGVNGANFFRRYIPGGLSWPHDFSIDPQGNLYVNNGRSWTVDKYVPKKDADKKRLMTEFRFKK